MHRFFVRCRFLVIALAVTATAAMVLFARNSQAVSSTPPASPQYYTEHVQPILQANCYRCHAGFNHRGGLQLGTRAGLMRGGKDGAVIVPGHPEQSLLLQLIRHEGPANDPKPMPPKSRLSDADIATIAEWIRAGAAMPADEVR
jgi:mono/diheme cytochrome c family protein